MTSSGEGDETDGKEKSETSEATNRKSRVVEEGAVSPDTTALIEPKTKFVDMIAQFQVKHLNISVLSDYEAELELFYIYFKVSSDPNFPSTPTFSGCRWRCHYLQRIHLCDRHLQVRGPHQ
jgi:hypothetical protein